MLCVRGLSIRASRFLYGHSFEVLKKHTQVSSPKIPSHFTVAFSAMATTNEANEPQVKDCLKLASFTDKFERLAVGVVLKDKIWPLRGSLKSALDLLDLDNMVCVIKAWPLISSSIKLEGEGIPLGEVKLEAPIPLPKSTIMCIGKNYADHVKEVDTWKTHPGITAPSIPTNPIVFTKAPQSVIGPFSAIKCPLSLSSAVDYEAELAVIIGKEGKEISKENAMDYVFGYTILNDVTARDLQKKHQQWFLGKSCDTFCPMGPWIVPASGIDGQDLRIQCWVDDELRQDGRTSQMLFKIPELISVISAGITLQPGDIIATGTPAGVGSGFNPPRHLKAGQTVKIRIENIGELVNPVT